MLPIIFPCWKRYLLLNCRPQWEAGTYPLLEQNEMTVEVFSLLSAETPEALHEHMVFISPIASQRFGQIPLF